MMLAELFGLLVGLRTKDMLHIAEVLRPGHIALVGRGVAVDVPQFHGRLQSGAESQVEIAMLRAPFDGLRTEDAWNPDRWARLLVGRHPGIDETIGEMLALPAERTRPRPGRENQVVRLVEQLAIVGRIGVVEDLLAACPAHPSGHQPSTRDA